MSAGDGLRRVISECEDIMMLGGGITNEENNNNTITTTSHPAAGQETSFGNFVLGYANVLVETDNNNIYNNMRQHIRNTTQGTISDISMASDVDMDAPLMLIESNIDGDDMNEDNSSLSCDDDSENVAGDLTMLLADTPAAVVAAATAAAAASNGMGVTTGRAAVASELKRVEGLNRLDSSQSVSTSGHSSKRDSQTSNWGWFEDVHQSSDGRNGMTPNGPRARGTRQQPNESNGLQDNSASAMAVTAPNYVLEESLSSQLLWKESAGQRPPQPVEERAFYEKMWAQNFARSQVDYKMPVEVLTAASPISLNPFADGNFEGCAADDHGYASAVPQESGIGPSDVAEATLLNRVNGNPMQTLTVVNKKVKDSAGEGDLTVLVRGDNVFGTTVSKSFARPCEQGGIAVVDTINISIASYRVVANKKHEKYAQFLVIYREGSIRNTVGIWKRYRDFEELANKVTQAHEGCVVAFANLSPLAVTAEPETEHLPNAITSWRLLKKRQRWYRCLDAGYLSLKVFLLERFLHDILFESSSPQLLRDFVGVHSDLF